MKIRLHPDAIAIRDSTVASGIYIDKKEKTSHKSDLSFMERVTRLELATSTLARWRSTG